MLRLGYAESTLERYDDALKKFLAWARAQGVTARSGEELDYWVTVYVHELYRSGKGKVMARHLLSALRLRCLDRYRLVYAEKCVGNWERANKPAPHPPLSWALVLLLANWMRVRRSKAAGAAIVVGFHLLLRGGELAALEVRDVASAADERLGAETKGAVVALRKTKTGNNQSVTVIDADVAGLLRSWTSERKGGESLFGRSHRQLLGDLREAAAAHGLQEPYVLHSLRHGGATKLFMDGWTVDNIRQRGRWAVTASSLHYIQESRALLLATELPPRVAQAVTVAVRKQKDILRALWK